MQNRPLIERQICVFRIVEKLDVILDPRRSALLVALVVAPFAWAEILCFFSWRSHRPLPCITPDGAREGRVLRDCMVSLQPRPLESAVYGG